MSRHTGPRADSKTILCLVVMVGYRTCLLWNPWLFTWGDTIKTRFYIQLNCFFTVLCYLHVTRLLILLSRALLPSYHSV